MKFNCIQCSIPVDSRYKRKFCSNECKHLYWNANNYSRKKKSVDAWKKANPNKAKEIKLKRHYGLSLDTYNNMKVNQNGVCKICKETCKSGRDLSVDHCHSTGKIRGLLCHRCNYMVGAAKDRIELLKAGVEYLEEFYAHRGVL